MRRRARRGGGRQIEVTVDSLGGRGDGVAQPGTTGLDKPVFVPFALPGERVRVRVVSEISAGYKAEILELLSEAPERVEPPCPHFGPCGGCTVQHLAPKAYETWKRELVVQALRRRGFEAPPVGELFAVGQGTRRRATLAARRAGKRVLLGFHGRESHEIEDIRGCHVLTARLVELLAPLRTALASVLTAKETAEVALLDSETGVDVLVTSREAPGLAAREALAALAQDRDLARIAWVPAGESGAEPEPVALRRAPVLTFGGIPVEPPPGGFVQPTAEGAAALTDAVTAWLDGVSGPVADLYAGCGTFTLPLTKLANVHAVEGGEAAMAALWQAARRNDLAGRVTAEVRDLASDPLNPDELSVFGAVVFDPPRAGAKDLAESLAESEVPTVVAVSCNPNTFARDARALVEGGYRLEEVRPVDQFIWTGHVELAAVFRRVG